MVTLLLLLFTAPQLPQADSKVVPAYIDACVRRAVAGRSPEQLDEKARGALRQELLSDLGLDPLPTRTPLNAQITGRLERDGYVIEKIVYETFPQFYASAYLYLPADGKPPWPAVVTPVGHWAKKKLEPVVQARCVGLALYGFAVLCIDMPGFIGRNNDERNFPGDHSNWLLHMASLPPAGVMVWDVVRGVDYLETRPEIDAKRIGLTGESGGGLTTMYAGVIEDRVRCYVPVCYANSYADNYQNGCFCNHVPGVMQIGDRSDVMALAAPKPILLIGAEVDPEFPRIGMEHSHAALLRRYQAAGAADGCELFIAPGGHDFGKPMRERMYGFMRKYLMGMGAGGPAPELRELPAKGGDPPVHVEDPGSREALCFPNGKAPADAKSLRQLALEKAQRLAADTDRDAADLDRAKLRERLRERLLKLYPCPERVPLDVQAGPSAGTKSDQAPPAAPDDVSGTYVSEIGLRIPFSVKVLRAGSAGGKAKTAAIIFSEAGLDDPTAWARYNIGPGGTEPDRIELRIDGRGLGRIPGLDMKLATYLGRPDVWMWAWDVSRAVDYLLARGDVDAEQIDVWGFGAAGGQVAYLAALLDPRIRQAYGQRMLRSYLDAFERDDLPRFALPHRILEVGDLPLMRKAVGP